MLIAPLVSVLDFVDDWRQLVTGRFVAHVVPGGHRTMLEPPNVEIFAEHLNSELARVKPAAALAQAG